MQAILRHYWKFLRDYKLEQSIILVSYGLGQLGSAVLVSLIYKEITDLVTNPPADVPAALLHQVYLLVAVIVSYNICFRIGDYYIIKLESSILKDLNDYALRELQKKSYSFFTNAFTGGLVAKVRRFVNAFETLYDQFVFQMWMSSIILIGSVSVLWYNSPLLGTIFLVWLALYMVLVRFLVRWQIPKSIANAEADSHTTAHLADILSNILTIKMFGTHKREEIAFAETTASQEKKRRIAWFQENFWNSAFQAAANSIFHIAIIGFAVELWLQGIVTVGTIVLVQVYVLMSSNVVWQISKNIVRISAALSDAHEMVAIIEQPTEVADNTHPEPIHMDHGHVEFRDVTFTYDNGATHVFHKLNLEIKQGERVALVGHSGAGKTTVVKLLLRFLDVASGTIFIDNQDITTVGQDELRTHIAYVPQEPLLFHRTLRENIAYAKPEATLDEVIFAAKRAHAHEFISKLSHGYDTLVGERGIKLSGGERQRVAIARAMLKDAPIVVLDEATSSLDSVSERLIQGGFDELMRGKTTIVIAHRLSTIQDMDRIIVFHDGDVAESGSHTDLLARDGVYATLWNSQVGGFIDRSPENGSEKELEEVL